ncbi:D-alanyl-D-alanine carboxypeptidase family protein [Garciella nitratireducens]|uniref:serine-type D-Ala-D-Ala carboxypeptidase n=1 Tax=Garciella nitratireducens DSM 15102 TaxID=1121911 RepID=A0A1T4JUA8_9FIRM|nr:D-alanyl-D-alanine carboxypeptidase family protein [Garciella nitratireducens]RBP45575.1 D-alanyl-D-alanine carboxypeptidase (penicillin-binding protein 5/6) [Garciella nitratireducens]SJZ33731.1 D-alanyl-D-alanine carboxypeptidase (penicillin-binding protein 5/6) [Garciella nitratireducens DSM 15102]
MGKRKIKIISILIIMLLSITGVSVSAQEIVKKEDIQEKEDLAIESKSAVLIDASTGKILFKKNKDEKLPPASITKIMTMLLTIEAVDEGKITLKDQVSISEQASEMGGTQLFLEPGEKRTVEELLIGVAVESANDAAAALGEYIGGNYESFIKMMNDKAKQLGMKNTYFKNANGLPEEGHYSTAYDVALMSKELVKHPKIHQYLTIWMTTLNVGKNDDKMRTLANTNKLLKSYEGLDGIKTGYTSEAKHCLSATAKKGNIRLISVILGAENSKMRFEEAAKLLDYGFTNYEGLNIIEKEEEIQKVSVEKGTMNTLTVVAKDSLNILLKKGEKNNIEKKIILQPNYTAPIKRGEKLGELIIYNEDKEIGKVNLIAKDSIEKSGVFTNYKKILNYWTNPIKE